VSDIVLKVGGQEFAGWQKVRVTRGIEAIAGSFELEVSERWGGQETPWPIGEEDECSIEVLKVPLITGWVDKRRLSYGAEDHSLEISGRDRAAALVDCSAVLKSWEFKNLSLLTLAQRLCEPFSVKVAMDPGLTASISLGTGKSAGHVTTAGKSGKRSGLGLPKPPKKFSVDPGESAFEVLDRACRMAGVLPVSDGVGGILLTRAGTARAATELVQGENILEASADFDVSGRYRRYIVSAQHQGADEWSGMQVAAVKGEATDENVRRAFRTLLVRPEGSVTPESAKVRAAWEAKIRAARGDSVSVTVQGWTQSDGTLWPINALVRVHSPFLGVDGDMLITQAVYSLDEGGTVTQLSLKRPDAFLPEPIVTQASTGLWKEIAGGV
jgi:prophage tail gpP-like protein